jgi:hypothetical protein
MNSVRKTFESFTRCTPAQATEATAFLAKHNMLEHKDAIAEVRSEPTHVAPTHAYLAEEYDFENCAFLITDNAGFYS